MDSGSAGNACASQATDGTCAAWEGGRDTFGWGIASYSPRYNIGAFATVRIDTVQNVVNPYLRYASAEDALEAWTCNVNDLRAFTDGPDLRPGENMARAKRMVEAEAEVRDFSEWLVRTVIEHVEPWWRATRSADALYRADPRWRKFWNRPEQRTALAVASLCAPDDVLQALEHEAVAATRMLVEMERSKVDAFVADLRARRSATLA